MRKQSAPRRHAESAVGRRATAQGVRAPRGRPSVFLLPNGERQDDVGAHQGQPWHGKSDVAGAVAGANGAAMSPLGRRFLATRRLPLVARRLRGGAGRPERDRARLSAFFAKPFAKLHGRAKGLPFFLPGGVASRQTKPHKKTPGVSSGRFSLANRRRNWRGAHALATRASRSASCFFSSAGRRSPNFG